MPTFENKLKEILKNTEDLDMPYFTAIIASNGAIGITLGKVEHKEHAYHIQPENERLETILKVDPIAKWYPLTDKENDLYLKSKK